MTVSKKSKSHFILIALVMIALAAAAAVRIIHYINSPDILFLNDRAGAHWIKYDWEFQLVAKPASPMTCRFRSVFNAIQDVEKAQINVQALNQCQIIVDGITVFSSTDDFHRWKIVHEIIVPFSMKAGPHELLIIVTSNNSYPAVIAYSDNLPVSTGPGWFASIDGKSWQAAVPASQIKLPSISKELPSSTKALLKILPFLTFIFIAAFIISFIHFRNDQTKISVTWQLEPFHIKWILMFLWAVLSVNNIFKLNFQTGADGWGHIEYIDYIVAKGSLPLANEGWQMFQAPLNYILSAPLYALFSKWMDFPSVVKALVILPVVCGLLQIEIVYRVARLVFAERKDLQVIAIVTGTLLPIHTFTCQIVGNEPLVGCFLSLLIFFSLSLMSPLSQERSLRYFIFMGFIWGLALLTKMTAILFTPVLIIVVLLHYRIHQKPLKSAVKPIMILFSVSLLMAGWFYLRNYVELGNPFVSVLDHSSRGQWWQDPGYRTWSQILSFGQSLVYPVYAGVVSFWDMVYSTLWLDGFNSGVANFVPWNENFMIAGSLLALLPSLFILTSVVSICRGKSEAHQNAVIFSTGIIVLFLIAMLDRFINCPFYSAARSGYTLGLLPCYAILVAAGAEPFLKNKLIRSFVTALFACWAFAAYAAYFVV